MSALNPKELPVAQPPGGGNSPARDSSGQHGDPAGSWQQGQPDETQQDPYAGQSGAWPPPPPRRADPPPSEVLSYGASDDAASRGDVAEDPLASFGAPPATGGDRGPGRSYEHVYEQSHDGGYRAPVDGGDGSGGVGPGDEPRERRSCLPVAGILSLVVIIGCIIAVVFFKMGTQSPEPTSAAKPSTSSSRPAATSAKPSTTAPAAPSTTAPSTTTPPPSSTTTTSTTSTTAPATFPAGATACDPNVATGTSTSCPFAANVASAVRAATAAPGSSFQVTAHSPTTNQDYTLTCSGDAVIACTGGNNATVYVKR